MDTFKFKKQRKDTNSFVVTQRWPEIRSYGRWWVSVRLSSCSCPAVRPYPYGYKDVATRIQRCSCPDTKM